MDEKLLKEALAGARSRGQVKALGRRFDTEPEVRALADRLAQSRGIEDAGALDGKRLVRALLGRSAHAQVRTNPIHRDEEFECMHCSLAVTRGGAQVRDHCPHCLHGKHVDDVPGDRAAECGGLLAPLEFNLEGRSGVVIGYVCQRCGHKYRVRSHPDDQLPKGLQVPE